MLAAAMVEHSTQLWLASASPRRRQLLESLRLAFEVEAANVDETLLPGEAPASAVLRLAQLKAEAVAATHPETWTLGSDTLVEVDGRPFGKPSDEAEARRMLAALSNRTHSVWTGVAMARAGQATLARAAEARVTFRALETTEIDAYVSDGEPLDKAGAYAFQGKARAFVVSVEGEESTVIGLPLGLTRELLRACGIRLP
jgi:septum formation protein